MTAVRSVLKYGSYNGHVKQLATCQDSALKILLYFKSHVFLLYRVKFGIIHQQAQ